MAVSSVSSSSSSSSIYGNRNVLSGLASGMDTESMIENMVMGIKNKIDTQKQNQQILLWQQTAYRSISDQLVQISNKYTSYTSATNLMSSSFFQPSIITSLGENAGKISASGSTTSNIEISQVTKMAQTETISFSGLNVKSQDEDWAKITGSAVDLKKDSVDVSNLAGKQLSFEYGNKEFTLTFDSNRKYTSVDDVVDEINKQLNNAKITMTDGTSVSMDSKILAEKTSDGGLSFKFKDPKESNSLELKSYSSAEALKALHLQGGATMDNGPITSDGPIKDTDLVTPTSVGDILAGTTMNVTYNGTTATIRMPEKDSAAYKAIFVDAADSKAAAKEMQKYLQQQFDQAFGYGRIEVGGASDTADTFTPTFTVDKNDTFSINSGSINLVGANSVFGIEQGASNRVNTSKSIGELMGLADGAKGFGDDVLKSTGKTDENGNQQYALVINGVTIGDKYTVDTSLQTIMNDINNNEAAGVKVTYSTTANQFVFTSKHGGAGGKIEISNADNNNLAATLFGEVKYDATGENITSVRGQSITGSSDEFSVIQGQDAEMEAYINGVKTTLTSGTNTFNIDGFTVTANGTFTTGDRVSFDAKVDTDKIVDAVKSFVDDYNKVLAEINEQYTTQPDHNKEYKPLTDDQKADMTEKQIEEYETKAKQGLLFGDSDLGSLSNALRFVFSNSKLDAIGVSVSSSYSDKGKIVLDETKLRSALASDPEAVAEAFAAPMEQKEVSNQDGSTSWVDDTSSGGAMARLKIQLDKYASTTGASKGILIEKAGSQYSPMALLQNTLQDKIDSYDDVIDKLTDQLNDKIDFYTSKFSKLEALIAQMNSQSSYLSSLGGGSY